MCTISSSAQGRASGACQDVARVRTIPLPNIVWPGLTMQLLIFSAESGVQVPAIHHEVALCR